MPKQKNKKLIPGPTPEDFTPKGHEAFDPEALAERLRGKEKEILEGMHREDFDYETIDDADIDPVTRAALKLASGAEFDPDTVLAEDHNEIAWKLLGYGGTDLLVPHLRHLHDLDKGIAFHLIEEGCSHDLVENLESFREGDYYEIMLTILKTNDYLDAVNNLQKIKNPDYPKLLSDLAEAGASSAIFCIMEEDGHLKEFNKVDCSKLVLKLIERTSDFFAIYSNVERFHGLNKKVFRKLLNQKCDYHSWLEKGLEAGVFKTTRYGKEDGLEAEDYNGLALKLLENGFDGGDILSSGLEHFFFLNEAVARRLIEKGYARQVRKHESAFDESVNLETLLKRAG